MPEFNINEKENKRTNAHLSEIPVKNVSVSRALLQHDIFCSNVWRETKTGELHASVSANSLKA